MKYECIPAISGIFGQYERGAEMGRACEMLLERPGMKEKVSRTRYPSEGMINHWTSPLKRTLQPMLEGYIIGLET